ncbi:MAG: branched-chain amino acid ABC transporter permease [Rhizobiales bacterium]|nr:branched-chain amino acid ABC transporter permease [Hyphomicrobiales bacterium]
MSVPAPPEPQSVSSLAAFIAGLKVASTSVFFFVIVTTYIGFGALAHDYGVSVGWATLSTVLMWAGPAQVILVTALGSGTTILEVAVAVGLSSVRFLPLVVALLPLIRTKKARPWKLLLPAHFVSVSVWVEGTRHTPGLARANRVAFCNGIGVGFVTPGAIATAVGFYLAATLPALFGAAAMFVTPLSFLLSTVRNSRLLLERLALVLGLIIGPLLAYHQIGLDLLWTGIIAGTLAYGGHRLRAARR